MFKIAICDDIPQVCHDIEKILLNHEKKEQLFLDIEVFYNGEDLSKYIKSTHGFDLIYLDIEMKGFSGLDVSREIRNLSSGFQTEIVFISGTTQYDRMLFDVQPLHFIPKPINEELVIRDLNLALRKTGCNHRKFIVRINQETICLNVNEILFFESHNRQISVLTNTKNYTYYGTLRDVLPQLPDFFIKIHNSYIINMHRVEAFRKNSVTMENGTTLPVSDSCRKAYLEHQKKELLGDTYR